MSEFDRPSTARFGKSAHRMTSVTVAVATRGPSRVLVMMLDLMIVAAGVMAAYLIRFEGRVSHQFFLQMGVLIPVLALFRVAVNYAFGVYRMVWRYVGLTEALRFAQAVAVVSTVLMAVRHLLAQYTPALIIPDSVIVMEGMFSVLGMTGARFLPRIMRERSRAAEGSTPTILIGAGEGGVAIVKEAARHPELGIKPIGFLDDDPAKLGMTIGNLPVLGAVRDLEKVVAKTGAGRAVVTSSKFPPKMIARIMDVANPRGIEVNIVRAMHERVHDGLDAAQTPSGEGPLVREVRIEDLLSRDPIPPSLSMADLRKQYAGKRILVTGAGGSIGSELCRQLALLEPAQLLLAERDETNLFEIERELQLAKLGGLCQPVLVDIMDGKAVERVFRDLQPQIVFHAAAYKHVPMMERFPWEAVRNNVFGTKQLVELSNEVGVERFVMVSTDKAINPTSVMGATKRMAEQIVQSFAPKSKTRFSCVRFGNVLGSRGSVVGIFKDQITKGGPVLVTHAEATRYFMTIPEAANLVIQAGTIGDNGEVFLLDMGEPVKIIDLARQMIRLMGFSEQQIGIQIVGTRPGEKLFEELSTDAENISRTELRKIHRCKPVVLDAARLDALIDRLQFVVRSRDPDGVRAALHELEIGYVTTPARRAPDSAPSS